MYNEQYSTLQILGLHDHDEHAAIQSHSASQAFNHSEGLGLDHSEHEAKGAHEHAVMIKMSLMVFAIYAFYTFEIIADGLITKTKQKEKQSGKVSLLSEQHGN